jgi:hypothetical protein
LLEQASVRMSVKNSGRFMLVSKRGKDRKLRTEWVNFKAVRASIL